MTKQERFREAMPPHHQLVLISGHGFHDEMCQLSDELSKIGLLHAFLSRPNLKHHWNSGWIEEGLNEIGDVLPPPVNATSGIKQKNSDDLDWSGK